MGVTSDPTDPELTRGIDTEPRPQAAKYLVLSEEERRRGFVRPIRDTYVHVGPPGPRYPLRDLNDVERERYTDILDYHGEPTERVLYVKYEEYPESEAPAIGRFWSQDDLDAAARGGCGATTTMAGPIAETYARQPNFYGATYCVHCQRHLPVGDQGEFVWDGTDERVGT